MRKATRLGLLGVSALGLSLVAVVPGAFAPTAAAQAREPLCRRAAALPALPPEAKPIHPQQQRYRSGGVYDSVSAPAMSPPSPPAPPPPPPAPEPMYEPPASDDLADLPAVEAPSEGDSISVTGSRAASSARESSAPASSADGYVGEARSAPGYHRPPRPRPQSGLLTAGDHDDLLNPELYASYAGRFLQQSDLRGLPKLDTRRVLTVAVQDESGRPVPFARVTLTCADGNSLSLATVADGTAVFYPGLDRLGRSVRLSVPGSAPRTVAIADGSGAQRQGVTLRSGGAPVRKFDLLLAIDTTGSMGDEIAYLKSELRTILADLRRSHPGLDIRLGLVAYKDQGDVYVTRTYPFVADVNRMQANLQAQYADGGGDYPEAMDLALARAVAQDWRPDAVKSLLLVADAPPHDENIGKAWRVAEAARAKRIQIVPVAASGVGDVAEYVMRAMAAATQSRYIFLTDDSGIGNPHATPAVDCFLVTHLDRLVRRVLDSQISGRRVEPQEGEVIRSVGRYEGGKCVLPPDYRQWEQY
ncbi:MAG TPA: VWA domain-containing protein [Allosphingosinicella sp.]|nr:VWA domain-containing protein [Allosphingosinicella sp.]